MFIKKENNRVILIPEKKTRDTHIKSLKKFSDDFMSERTQPETQKREELFAEVHALCRGVILVTNNIREFKRIKSLKVVDWTV